MCNEELVKSVRLKHFHEKIHLAPLREAISQKLLVLEIFLIGSNLLRRVDLATEKKFGLSRTNVLQPQKIGFIASEIF